MTNKSNKVDWHISMKHGLRRALTNSSLDRLMEATEKAKAKVRARGEHAFHVIKNLFYRGLAKNQAQLFLAVRACQSGARAATNARPPGGGCVLNMEIARKTAKTEQKDIESRSFPDPFACFIDCIGISSTLPRRTPASNRLFTYQFIAVTDTDTGGAFRIV
ncbi:hypothetical protein J2T57_004347 [Natronocella acetinitrilica]|uniref:Uncharacterized protein n=1 Tax=Natronocella acetinitrilica TaxID=414046 RepID=A0AAE3G788_9GAMM|nr:hypothetical protein [Natronocella acetinitrilica]